MGRRRLVARPRKLVVMAAGSLLFVVELGLALSRTGALYNLVGAVLVLMLMILEMT